MARWTKEKDVALSRAARLRLTKNASSPPKTHPASLPGYVEMRAVRCGKSNCKCATGEPHGVYFYHVWTENGRRRKRYVRHADVPAVLQACKARREARARLRDGRALLRALAARMRELL